MKHTKYPFRFGTVEIEYEEETLIRLRCNPTADEITQKDLAGRSTFTDQVMQQVEEYLDGKRDSFDLQYALHGTDFQKKVWNALLSIPYGQTRSYRDIAVMIGNPKAVRAVGMANNRNPLMLIIPCHRVIGADGKLVGYAGGLEMKSYLLQLEQNHIDERCRR